MRVVVVGGGYAGLACLLELHADCAGAELYLVDPGEGHIKNTLLHQTLRRPLAEISEPYEQLAERFRFAFVQAAAGRDDSFDAEDLARWDAQGELELADGRTLSFDYLVIATGARSALGAGQFDAGNCIDKETLRASEGAALLDQHLWPLPEARRAATVVGGGASGVQVAFELAELMRRSQRPGVVRLVDDRPSLFPGMPARVHEYIVRRMRDARIEYLPSTNFVTQQRDNVRLQQAGGELEMPNALSLLFAGIAPHPQRFDANRFGQVSAGDGVLERVFTAGDCSRFASRGLNSATAQAAVRKGKQVGVNISRLARRRLPIAYTFAELGYVVSLGALDAVGWAVTPHNVLTGLAAFGARELVDAQYDLFVHGLDTYLV